MCLRRILIIACTPQIYVEEGPQLAKHIRKGTVENIKKGLTAYAEKSLSGNKEIKEAVIKFAQKILKYPDMRKAAYDKSYRDNFE